MPTCRWPRSLRQIHVVLDADDVDALRDFWIAALGYEEFGAFEQYRSAVPPDGANRPKFIFQKVPEGRSSGKNRFHIDSEASASDAVGADMSSRVHSMLPFEAAASAAVVCSRMASASGVRITGLSACPIPGTVTSRASLMQSARWRA